ncbi:hypothetical protein AU467_06740 [Mesorhizobium loti]|uniref:Uncharacterized protein n=1 Tax=Rhizobium loti TaxID=381 RepID=A0A117N276_RHILI|nr:hypothetical protein AU467_06740 [Mesorhizobium loti]
MFPGLERQRRECAAPAHLQLSLTVHSLGAPRGGASDRLRLRAEQIQDADIGDAVTVVDGGLRSQGAGWRRSQAMRMVEIMGRF